MLIFKRDPMNWILSYIYLHQFSCDTHYFLRYSYLGVIHDCGVSTTVVLQMTVVLQLMYGLHSSKGLRFYTKSFILIWDYIFMFIQIFVTFISFIFEKVPEQCLLPSILLPLDLNTNINYKRAKCITIICSK